MIYTTKRIVAYNNCKPTLADVVRQRKCKETLANRENGNISGRNVIT